jgi:hypothetical protein
MAKLPAIPLQGKKLLEIIQRTFDKGYISVLESSRIPNDGLSDMTNIDVVQDSIVKPRPSTVAYGPTALGTFVGIGTFTKVVSGTPTRYQITMQVIGGVGQVVINKDGGAWTTIGGSYDTAAWCMFTQSRNRVYISNGINTMSYYDINAGTIITYSALPTPTTPTLAASTSLTSGSPAFPYLYAHSANNNVGETAAVMSAQVLVNKLRDGWVQGTDQIAVTGSPVTGALSYNWYIAIDNNINDFQFLATTSSPSFTDDGSTVENIFKSAPPGDSTSGPILSYLIADEGQLFGVGSKVSGTEYNMWYSGSGQHSGDFSPFNGGGYAYINYGGDALPTCVQSFHDGKGNPVISVLTTGQAGSGKLYHASYTSTTYGATVIPYYQIYEAAGQSGTISPFGVVQADNGNIYYPTGDNFKSTGMAQGIVNMLAINSVSQAIDPDVRALNLSAMSKCVGLFYRQRIFWAVPNGTSNNNEIWITDLARGGLWILRWTVPATWLWLYEDNSGVTHMCALVNNVIVEFTTNVQTMDQGVPFSTRVASGSIVWDPSAISMAAIQNQFFKLLFPKGTIQINNYGISDDITVVQTLGNDTFAATVSNTGYGEWDYSGLYYYGYDVGFINYYAQAVGMVIIDVDDTLNEISWEIITTDANCDYTLSTVTTIGVNIPRAYLGQ